MPNFFLSQNDVDTLKRVLQDVDQFRLNSRANLGSRSPAKEVSNANAETYIIYPQTADGIPARSGSVPGEALCDVYIVRDNAGTPTLYEWTDKEIYVLNLTETALEQTYMTATRDKWGRWIAGAAGGGGGSSIIHFSIQSADCDTGCGIGTVIARSCGDVSVGDDISIYDGAGCFLTGNELLLVGRKGYAALMSGDDPCPGTGTWMGVGTATPTTSGCVWHIISLCCSTESCG